MSDDRDEPRFTSGDVARELGIPSRTARRYIATGQIQAKQHPITGRWKVSRAALDGFLHAVLLRRLAKTSEEKPEADAPEAPSPASKTYVQELLPVAKGEGTLLRNGYWYQRCETHGPGSPHNTIINDCELCAAARIKEEDAKCSTQK